MSTSKSEYLVWKQAAEDACETMSEYARKAVKQRFEQENPHKLGFGEEFRMNSGTLAKMVGTVAHGSGGDDRRLPQPLVSQKAQ